MNERIKYTDEYLGDVKVIPDFLPPPHELHFKEETEAVTLILSKKSVDFFKSTALKNHVPYQDLICQFLDNYASNFSDTSKNQSR